MGGRGGTEGSGADQVSTAAGGLFWLLFGLLLIRGAPRGTRHREQGAIVVLAVDPAGVRAARVRQRHTGDAMRSPGMISISPASASCAEFGARFRGYDAGNKTRSSALR